MSATNAAWKPFVAGIITTIASVYIIVPKLQDLRRKARRNRVSTTSQKDGTLLDSPQLEQRMIRKAEGAIRRRTSRITIVVERCTNDHNYSAILRTAEALGVQNVYIIDRPADATTKHTTNSTPKPSRISEEDHQARTLHHLFARKAMEWLSVREFPDTASCLAELRQTKHTVWVTDLSQEAISLTKEALCHELGQSSLLLPSKLAIVFGTEAVGCTQEMLEAADLRVYLPLRGFADSLNLSVATALVVHQLFVLDPSIEGDMSEAERRALRQRWFAKLAKQRLMTPSQKRNYLRLVTQIKGCQAIQTKQENGDHLHKEQVQKLDTLTGLLAKVNEIEEKLDREATIAVQDLVDNPPDPITDMRRADEHRTWFGGRNTKKSYGDLWDNMPATTTYDTAKSISTSDFFRSRAATGDLPTSK